MHPEERAIQTREIERRLRVDEGIEDVNGAPTIRRECCEKRLGATSHTGTTLVWQLRQSTSKVGVTALNRDSVYHTLDTVNTAATLTCK